eukprot:scaffold102479_cov32-Prasinocladus_malaysianus.AAC.1
MAVEILGELGRAVAYVDIGHLIVVEEMTAIADLQTLAHGYRIYPSIARFRSEQWSRQAGMLSQQGLTQLHRVAKHLTSSNVLFSCRSENGNEVRPIFESARLC